MLWQLCFKNMEIHGMVKGIFFFFLYCDRKAFSTMKKYYAEWNEIQNVNYATAAKLVSFFFVYLNWKKKKQCEENESIHSICDRKHVTSFSWVKTLLLIDLFHLIFRLSLTRSHTHTLFLTLLFSYSFVINRLHGFT